MAGSCSRLTLAHARPGRPMTLFYGSLPELLELALEPGDGGIEILGHPLSRDGAGLGVGESVVRKAIWEALSLSLWHRSREGEADPGALPFAC
jgi:hypothetical protein